MDSFKHERNERTLTVKVKNYYGVFKAYPNCELSRKFAALLKQSTFTKEDCDKIKSLGYFFNVTEEKI